MKKKQIIGLIIAVIMFTLSGMISVLTHTFSQNMLSSNALSFTTTNIIEGNIEHAFPVEPFIAVVEVTGTIQEQTELGIEANKYMSAGELVPDAITVPMVANRLNEEDAKNFWETLRKDAEILEELEYYAAHGEFLCKYKVAGYTVTDILVWQVDHFKAYLDRREEINRYRQDKLIYNSFEILLQMRQNPEPFVNKLQGETGTDYEGKY